MRIKLAGIQVLKIALIVSLVCGLPGGGVAFAGIDSYQIWFSRYIAYDSDFYAFYADLWGG